MSIFIFEKIEMAETLFRQWFVEEAGEDWEEVPLSYFGKIICGKTPSKKKPEFYNGDIPFIKIPDSEDSTSAMAFCSGRGGREISSL
jgi:hypothetical protein